MCILSTVSNFKHLNCAISRNTSLFAKTRAEILDKARRGCIIITRQGVLDRMFFLPQCAILIETRKKINKMEELQ